MMGAWLARLKNEKLLNTSATKPTKPPLGDEKAGFVGFVAYLPVPLKKIEEIDSLAMKPEATAANDGPSRKPAPATAPDLWCWPNSVAWNSKEIETFAERLARFTDKGLSYEDAERLADALLIRDREGDDRRLCLECTHLQGAGRWICGNWKRADVARDGLAREMAVKLQRCGGFVVGQPCTSGDRR